MRSLWPSFLLKRSLKKEMIMIHKDDVALNREGVEILNENELQQVKDVRYMVCTEQCNSTGLCIHSVYSSKQNMII